MTEPSDLSRALADRYVIGRLIGQGGMAVVYAAEDLRHRRPVALKVMRASLANEGLVRFRREIALTANLQHPHILPVFDSGECAGTLWYVMPFIEGETLAARLRREGRLPVPVAIRLLREIADALDHAHTHGVVHRDLKPENILLSGDHAVIADFGVAKAIVAATGPGTDGTVDGTREGVSIGTPAYMAPEQVAADPSIDHRADLYALGVIAYELLSGSKPFTGTTPQALFAAHLSQRPKAVSSLCPAVPPALDQLVSRLLEKEPSARPATARAVRQLLDAIPHDSSSNPASRRKVWGAISAVALITLIVAMLWGPGRDQEWTPRKVHLFALVPISPDSSVSNLGEEVALAIRGVLGRAPTGAVIFTPGERVTDAQHELEAARDAGADLMLSGRYRMTPDSIMATLELTDVESGTVRDPRRVTVARSERDSLPALLGQHALVMLHPDLSPEKRRWALGALPQNPRALAAFEQGLASMIRGDPFEARRHWLHSAQLDSSYAAPILNLVAAMAGPLPEFADSLLQVIARRHQDHLSPADQAYYDFDRALLDGRKSEALNAAQRISEAEPGAPLPHFFRAYVAIQSFRPGLALGESEQVYKLGTAFRAKGSFVLYLFMVTEARHQRGNHQAELEAARAGMLVEPGHRAIMFMELRALAALGQLADLERVLDQFIASPDPAFGEPISVLLNQLAGELSYHGHIGLSRRVLERSVSWQRPRLQRGVPAADMAHFALAQALYHLGQFPEAAKVVERLGPGGSRSAQFLALRALIAHKLGGEGSANRAIAQLDSTAADPLDRGRSPYAAAQVAAQVGDIEAAVARFEEALNRGQPLEGMWIHDDLMLAPLRNNEMFLHYQRPLD